MQVALTKKLADALKMEPAPADDETEPLLTWTANWITTWANRKAEDMLVLVNNANRFAVVIYEVKRKDLKNFKKIITTAITNTLLAMNYNPEMVDEYMKQAGEITYVKNSNRKATSWANRAGQEAAHFVGQIYNGIDTMYDDSTIGAFVSDTLVGTAQNSKKYAVPSETMAEDLAEFTGMPAYNSPAFELLVTLDLEAYKATRRIIVPSNLDLYKLHAVLQKIFNWDNAHLYDFKVFEENDLRPVLRLMPYVGDIDYGTATILDDHILSDFFPKYERMVYTYDLGDSWDHEIELVRVIEAHDAPSPYLLEASGQTPPEDVGGVGGFLHIREILEDPEHPNHGEMERWVGNWSPELSDWEKMPKEINI